MATETLRPNAPGDETNNQPIGDDPNWRCVDEATADDASTYIRNSTTSYLRDLYHLPSSSGSGTINFIKVYFKAYTNAGTASYVRPSLKSDSTVTDGTVVRPPAGTWTMYSEQWNANPADSAAWAWGDIDALQIGANLKASSTDYRAYLTQVYVEVDYTGPHTIVATAGTNGMIVPSGSVEVSHGDDQSFAMTPDSYYEIDEIIVDGNPI